MRRRFVIAVIVVSALAAFGANASGPVDLANRGDAHESFGQASTPVSVSPVLSPGVTYRASTFPLAITARSPDALWNGVQGQSRTYRFVQFFHNHPPNLPPLNGWGYVTLEASVGRTPSAAATIQKLHATPLLDAGAIRGVRVSGFSGKTFDTTVVGSESDSSGIALNPFTKGLHCGWCTSTMHGETLDTKFAGKGQLFRIMAIPVRGKTVVIYLESSRSDSTTRKHPPAETFPTFLPYAQKLLSALTFPR